MGSNRIFYTYERILQNDTTGHIARYKFRLFYLSSKITWPFKTEYYTHCSLYPTSFRLNCTFSRVSPSGCVNIPVHLERRDFQPTLVDAFVNVKISDANGLVIFDPPFWFGLDGMAHHQIFTDTISGVIWDPKERYGFNEQIDIEICLKVHSCHSENAGNLQTQGKSSEALIQTSLLCYGDIKDRGGNRRNQRKPPAASTLTSQLGNRDIKDNGGYRKNQGKPSEAPTLTSQLWHRNIKDNAANQKSREKPPEALTLTSQLWHRDIKEHSGHKRQKIPLKSNNFTACHLKVMDNEENLKTQK